MNSCIRCTNENLMDYPVCPACAPLAHFTYRSDCRCESCSPNRAKSPNCSICHGAGLVTEHEDTGAPGVSFAVEVPCECQAESIEISSNDDWCEICFSSDCIHVMKIAA